MSRNVVVQAALSLPPRRTQNARRGPRLAAVVVVCLSVAAACASPSTTAEAAPEAVAEAPVVDVPVATAVAGPIEATLEISGTLTPQSRVAVKPRLPGALDSVLVDIGDRVTEGQVIATLDRREIDAQADAAEAAVAVARAALDAADTAVANAGIEHERARNLFEKGALPRQRLDAADTAHRAARAQRDLAAANLAQAEASQRRAREVQRDATLRSPVTGFVVERNYDAGAIPGDRPVVVVADLRVMKLEAGVSEMDAGRLGTGMKARVAVQARPGEVFEGRLAAIAPEADPRNRHFRIEVRIPNADRALLSGMFATARIVEATAPNAVLLPREAVTTRDGKRIVLKIQGDKVVPAPVAEALTDGTRVQIVDGVTAGDRVVADPRRQLPAGAKVRAIG